MRLKQCCRCRKVKNESDFNRDKYHADLLRSVCRSCGIKESRYQYRKNRKRRIASSKKWAKENHEKFLLYNRTRRAKLRDRIIEGYGAKCRCCGETIKEFLTIEHPMKDGKQHRKQCGGGVSVYVDLIRRKFPPPYFLLCCNCNYSERYGRACPHKALAQASGK